jgi:hypothetical protein
MGYVLFAFVDPPPIFGSAFLVPPVFPTTENGRKVGRVLVGLLLIGAALGGAYVVLRA